MPKQATVTNLGAFVQEGPRVVLGERKKSNTETTNFLPAQENAVKSKQYSLPQSPGNDTAQYNGFLQPESENNLKIFFPTRSLAVGQLRTFHRHACCGVRLTDAQIAAHASWSHGIFKLPEGPPPAPPASVLSARTPTAGRARPPPEPMDLFEDDLAYDLHHACK